MSQTLHHVGFVVASIEPVIQDFARSLQAAWDGRIVEDPLQRVKVAFLQPQEPGGPQLELVAPSGETSPVARFLEKGGGMHHVCYEVDDISAQLEFMRSVGATIVSRPKPAVAFGGRLIAWVFTRQKLLIEFLQRAAPG